MARHVCCCSIATSHSSGAADDGGSVWETSDEVRAMHYSNGNGNGNGAAKRTGTTALVAGGAGFLGSHLCERLLADYETVVCVDNYATGSPENVAHLNGHQGFRMVKCGVAKLSDQHAGEPQAIFNLACP